MTTINIILQGFLTFVFMLAGGMKLAQTREKVIASGGKWAEDFTEKNIKLIGLGEFLCACGVYMPQLLSMPHAGWIVTASAVGICIFMGGAFMTHLRRKEKPFLIITAVFFLMALGVIYLNCPSCHTTAV